MFKIKSIELRNGSIVKVYNFLKKLPLQGKASRGRTKFQKRLLEKEEEFILEKKEIQKKYIQVDEFGEFVVLEDGVSSPFVEGITNKEKEEFVDLLIELENEKFEISFIEYSDKYDALFEALEKLTVNLSGEEADAYDELMDAYEKNKEEK